MKINIKKLDGTQYSLEVTPETTVPELKQLIQDASTISVSLQRVIYKGKVLKDDKDLQFYNIEDGVTLHLAERAPETNNPTSSSTTSSSSSSSSSSTPSRTSRLSRDDVLNSVMRSFVPPQIPFDTQLRNAIANVNNPSQTLVTGPVPPGRNGQPYDPQAEPSHERLSNYIDLTLIEINQLVDRMNHLNEQLRNNNNITDADQRAALQAEATSVGLSLSRLSNATSLLSQCTNAFRTTNQTNGTHFVPSISQITLNLGPNGLTPVTTTTTTTPADLLNLPNPNSMHPIPGIPGSFISVVPQNQVISNRSRSGSNASASTTSTTSTTSNATTSPTTTTTTTTTTVTSPQPQPQPQSSPPSTTTSTTSTTTSTSENGQVPDEINNVISQTLNGLFSSLGQQSGSDNPLGGILNSVLSSVNSGNASGGVSVVGGNDLSGIFSNLSQMFQQPSSNNNNNTNNNNNNTSPLSIIFNNMPQFLNAFQLISNGAEPAIRQGHRVIRQILVQQLLSGNSSPDNLNRMVESYGETIRQQVSELQLSDSLRGHIRNNSNLAEIVSRIAKKYLQRFLSIFISPPETSNLQNEIQGFSSDFVKELIESLSECFDNGSEGAFNLIDTFVNQKIISNSSSLSQFSTMTSQYLRDVYQSNQQDQQQQQQQSSQPLRATTTTTTTSSSSSDSIIPPEWNETIEIDQARQSTGTSRTPSSTYIKGKTPKVKKEKDPNNNNDNITTTTTTTTTTPPSNSPFRQVLQRSVEGTQIDGEELLKTEESNQLAQMYQNLFIKKN